MSDVFYLRPMDPPITPADVVLPEFAAGCLQLHRVDWKQSFLAADGGRLLCWYTAPDAESARIALRQMQSDMAGVWPGTVSGGDGPGSPALSEANAVAELRFRAPPGEQELDAVVAALQHAGATLVRCFVPVGEPKCVCAVQAPDERAVEAALEEAGVAAVAVWACTSITPAGPPTR